MALVCSKISITWFDGEWPSESGELVLLGEDELIDSSALLPGAVEQLIQRADYARGEVPDFWVRGGRTTSFEWDRIRPADRHDQALILALENAAELPSKTGWVLIEFPDYGRQFTVIPAAVRRGEWRYDATTGHLRQRWTIEAGVADELATDAPDDAILTDTRLPILTDDGYYLAMDTATE